MVRGHAGIRPGESVASETSFKNANFASNWDSELFNKKDELGSQAYWSSELISDLI